MLGSNQRPLPCEFSAMVCWGFLELAKSLQIAVFLRRRFSQAFRRFTRVAAQARSTGVSGRLERLLPRRRGLAGPSFAEESAEDRHEPLGLLDVG
jgi:hypothetical protein